MELEYFTKLAIGITSVAKNVKELLAKEKDQKIDPSELAGLLEPIQQFVADPDLMFKAMESIHNLENEIRTLQNTIDKLEDWEEEIEDYKLVHTDGGADVYVSDTPHRHYICPSCFANKLRQILQDNNNSTGYFTCPSCNQAYHIKSFHSSPIQGESNW